jgi:arylsulfatase
MGRLAEDALTPGVLSRLLGERAEIVPTADSITDRTLRWVDQNPQQPMFLYVHYIDPHDPYRPPAPYDRSFDGRTDPPRRAGGVDPLQLLGPDADREKVARWIDLYDGEILYADHHVGRLLQGLESRGLLRNTLVLVTADHGEEFFEHGHERHGTSTYQELLHIPMIASWPGRIQPGTTASAPVTHLDLMPTLLEIASAPAPSDMQGQSITKIFKDPATEGTGRLLFAQIVQDGFALEMVRDGRYKLVRHNHGPRKGQVELYDLKTDPLERADRSAQAAGTTAGLLKALNAFNAVVHQKASQIRPEQVQKLDRDTERALRSLGYIK